MSNFGESPTGDARYEDQNNLKKISNVVTDYLNDILGQPDVEGLYNAGDLQMRFVIEQALEQNGYAISIHSKYREGSGQYLIDNTSVRDEFLHTAIINVKKTNGIYSAEFKAPFAELRKEAGDVEGVDKYTELKKGFLNSEMKKADAKVSIQGLIDSIVAKLNQSQTSKA